MNRDTSDPLLAGTQPGPPGLLGPGLVYGFGTAVAMWLAGFVARLPAVQLPPIGLGLVLIAAPLVGGALIARRIGSGRALTGAALAGLITSALNLLVVGAVVAKTDATNELRPDWVWVVLGAVSFGITASMFGAAAGLARAVPGRGPEPTSADWLGRFALVTVLSAVPVLLSGGLVTSTNTGLAVPDWPTSYGAHMFLYPIAKMTGGIYYEHAHRLFGSLVGLTTLTLLVFTLVVERRGWVKVMVIGAFVLVCAQGVLGGVRVVAASESAGALRDNPRSLALAMIHGTTAQLFLAYLAMTAVVLSRAWRSMSGQAPARRDGLLRGLSVALVAMLVFQLVLGSGTRHFHHGHMLLTHIGMAVLLVAAAGATAFRAIGRHHDQPVLRRLGHAVLHSLILQIALGVLTLLAVLPYETGKVDPPGAVVLATAHQAVGAMLLACAAALALWTHRLVPGHPTAA